MLVQRIYCVCCGKHITELRTTLVTKLYVRVPDTHIRFASFSFPQKRVCFRMHSSSSSSRKSNCYTNLTESESPEEKIQSSNSVEQQLEK